MRQRIKHDLTRGRKCNYCKLYKDRSNFYASPTGFNGLQSACKECFKVSSPYKPDMSKRHYESKKQAGVCVRCSTNTIMPTSTILCEDCWFKDTAYIRAGGRCNSYKLKKLWDKQSGKCFYTGKTLIPGENASIDHIIPKADGGTDEISNLVWADNRVNSMKCDMNIKIFEDVCKLITTINNRRLCGQNKESKQN
jgi:hypothetical protein